MQLWYSYVEYILSKGMLECYSLFIHITPNIEPALISKQTVGSMFLKLCGICRVNLRYTSHLSALCFEDWYTTSLICSSTPFKTRWWSTKGFSIRYFVKIVRFFKTPLNLRKFEFTISFYTNRLSEQ